MLSFCFIDLSIRVSGVLKSPTIIVLLLISSFILFSICLTYCGVPMLGAAAADAKSPQLCPNLCNPMDYSPPGSSAHGIIQTRTLEWAAISFSMFLTAAAAAKSLQS